MLRTHPYATAIRDPEIEQRLTAAMTALAAAIETAALPGLAAVYLGGGYGRGAGGVAAAGTSAPRLYNDVDFFVFTAGAGRAERARINRFFVAEAAKLREVLAVDVDFAPAREAAKLLRAASTLMFQELRYGHWQVGGQTDVLAALPEILPSSLPLLEAARLLMNRGMGLLLAEERLFPEFFARQASDSGSSGLTAEDADFIVRNLHKAALGAGDALLIAAGAYDWDAAARQAKLPAVLGNWPAAADLCAAYDAALEFKFRPSAAAAAPETRLNLQDAWRRTGHYWRLAVRRFCGLPDFPAADCAAGSREVAEALHTRRELTGGRSWRNAARWLWRNRSLGAIFGAPGSLRDAPIGRVLAEVYAALAAAPERPKNLRRHWEQFN